MTIQVCAAVHTQYISHPRTGYRKHNVLGQELVSNLSEFKIKGFAKG